MRYVVGAVIALLLTAPAHASKYVDIARSEWPDSPCTGHENITVADLTVDGLAWPADCSVAISNRLSGYKECVTLVHEFGHLAGKPHGEGVMRPDPTSFFHYACYKATRSRITLRAAKDALFLVSLGERVSCRRSGLGAVCRTGVARWRVWDDPYLGIVKKRLRDAPH